MFYYFDEDDEFYYYIKLNVYLLISLINIYLY